MESTAIAIVALPSSLKGVKGVGFGFEKTSGFSPARKEISNSMWAIYEMKGSIHNANHNYTLS